jgi:hypothetical protein
MLVRYFICIHFHAPLPYFSKEDIMATASTPATITPEDRIAGWLAPGEFSVLEAVCDIDSLVFRT